MHDEMGSIIFYQNSYFLFSSNLWEMGMKSHFSLLIKITIIANYLFTYFKQKNL